MEEIIVKRDGKRDLKFKGEQLVSSSDRWEGGKENTRWSVITIYQTESGKFIIAWEYVTLWQGESCGYRADICETPEDVINELVPNGDYYDLAKEIIGELAAKDERFKVFQYEEV